MLPEDEARQRMLQSQRLLGEGNLYLAKIAANIAVAVKPSPSTTENLHSAAASRNEQTRSRLHGFPFREAVELHSRQARIGFARLVGYVPEAYRVRVAAAMFILGLAIVSRYLYGGALPLRWLLTGVSYYKLYDNGSSFSFFISPSVGWVFLIALIQFFLHRPERRPERR